MAAIISQSARSESGQKFLEFTTFVFGHNVVSSSNKLLVDEHPWDLEHKESTVNSKVERYICCYAFEENFQEVVIPF